MFTKIDTGDGTVRTTWDKVRGRVKDVNPVLFSLIDELSPDESFPIYIVYLPYGQLKGDTICSFLPGSDGVIHRLNSPDLPKKIIDELGYGVTSSPIGMVLEKNLEYYIDIPALKLTLPRFILGPGSIFPITTITRIFSSNEERNYAPNGLLSAVSGCRSVFMLPHIGAKNHYERLQHDFNLTCPRPEQLYQHFNIFKELAHSNEIKTTWKSCIIYFSKKWVSKIMTDPAWLKVKMYLYGLVVNHLEPERSKSLLDTVFSYIQFEQNLKPNPYIVDTARHILHSAIGNVPGFAPASNEDFLPIADIEKPFIESYGMKKYFPTIMHPQHFIYENNPSPVYYSLQFPSTLNFSPKSRAASSMLVEMRELSTILKIFLRELSKSNSSCADTVLGKIANEVTIECIHNQADRKNIIKESNFIEKIDERFSKNFMYENIPEQRFAADGKFFRGCVSIQKKEV